VERILDVCIANGVGFNGRSLISLD